MKTTDYLIHDKMRILESSDVDYTDRQRFKNAPYFLEIEGIMYRHRYPCSADDLIALAKLIDTVVDPTML